MERELLDTALISNYTVRYIPRIACRVFTDGPISLMGKGQQQKEQRKVIVIGVSLVTGLPKTLPCWREKRRRIEQKLLVLHEQIGGKNIEKKQGCCSQRVATFCLFKGNWITAAAQTRVEEEEAKNRGRLFRCWWTRASDQIGAHSSFYLTGPQNIISVSRHKRLQIRHFFLLLFSYCRNEK